MNLLMDTTANKEMIQMNNKQTKCDCIDCWTDRVLKDLQDAQFVRGNAQEAIYDAIELICQLTGRELEDSEF